MPPLAPRKLPSDDMLPRRRTAAEVKTMFPIQIELQGYCPVSYLDGKCRCVASRQQVSPLGIQLL